MKIVPSAPLAGIVTVNWNGWADTLECLEAIFKLEDFFGPVVVIDNCSTDGSVDYILGWAAGDVCVLPEVCFAEIVELTRPVPRAPIDVMILTKADVADPGFQLKGGRLHVYQSSENLGFAAGNNVGISVLLTRADIDLVWLINNDALPETTAYRKALEVLLPGMQQPFICGNALREYFQPGVLQALGGRFNLYSGHCSHVGAGWQVSELPKSIVTMPVDYPIGAGIFVNRAYIRKYGLMSVDYFLYYEEVDWVYRAGWPSQSFCIVQSRLFHKGGASTKGADDFRRRSLTADYYMIRGRLLFARKLGVIYFVGVTLATLFAVVRRVGALRGNRVVNAFQAYIHGLSGVSGRRR
jgi:GT2 family glycosyltransferase